jgi:ketosteroid isomerase-like protein
VRSLYADWGRGDFRRLDWVDTDIEPVSVGGPEPGKWNGTEAVGRAWPDFLTAWDSYRVAGEEYRELDDGRVVTLHLLSGRGKKGSGLEVSDTETTGANLFHIRGGKVTKLVRYWDRDRAFADLGLEE